MQKITQLLADGEFHSGDELGEALSVSRAAVWKKIEKLRESGLDVHSVKGKGYRLAYPLELLDAATLMSYIGPSVQLAIRTLDVLSVVTSTNDIAMSNAEKGSGYVCIAEQQTSGRGRRGRPWVSPYASNIYVSVVWEFHQGASQLEGLSLATGVALVGALNKLGIERVKLKWPNDILRDGKKLAGILLEMTGDPSGRCQVVLGVGVNHRLPLHCAAQIDQPWVRVEDVQPGISRNRLASQIISELILMLQLYSVRGFSAYRDQWQALDVYADKEVSIHAGDSVQNGIARGIDGTGGLKLETDVGIKIMKGGEVSLRRLHE